MRVFIERGHEVHAISYYPPARDLPGVRVHVLRPSSATSARTTPGTATRGLAAALPPSARRLVHAMRYRRAGLRRVVEEIAPDVLHAHFVVEHGFYGVGAAFHPYVVSAWGSDLYRAPATLAGRLIARRTLGAADLVTANDPDLARRALALGADRERVQVVRLGVDPVFLETGLQSVNLKPSGASPMTVLSDRALEPLYNVDVVLRAFARLRRRLPGARLVVAGDGSQRAALARLAVALGIEKSVVFTGHVGQQRLLELLVETHVYVSAPSSDSLAVSTMEAMAVGAFPVVSDLPSQDWIVDRVSGLRVPVRDDVHLAEALERALTDGGLRRQAAALNRAKVEAEGVLEKNMLAMERQYYRLAGRPLAGDAAV